MEKLDALPQEARKWGWAHYARLWFTMQVNPFSLVMGGAVLQQGLGAGVAIATSAVSSLVVTLALVTNSAAGAKYGIPFPVYARAAFGLHGAKVIAMVRGIVAIFWLSIQNWFGSQMMYYAISSSAPGILNTPRVDGDYLNLGEFLLFLAFTGTGGLLVALGLERMGGFVKVATFFGFVALIALAVMAFVQASPAAVHRSLPGAVQAPAVATTLPVAEAINSEVSTWSTMVLNMADLSRFAESQKAQVVGQAVGFPTVYVILFSFSIFLCGSFYVAQGRLVWDLAPMLAAWSPWFSIPVAICLSVGIQAVNLSANIVSPANDFANLWPGHISFRAGAYATLVLSLATVPWRVMASSQSLMRVFLSGYSMLTGGIFAVMTVNYFAVHRCELDCSGLYVAGPAGPYHGPAGFRPLAFAAVLGGAALCVPGWLHDLGTAGVPAALRALFDLSWFVSAAAAALLYAALRLASGAAAARPPRPKPGAAADS